MVLLLIEEDDTPLLLFIVYRRHCVHRSKIAKMQRLLSNGLNHRNGWTRSRFRSLRNRLPIESPFRLIKLSLRGNCPCAQASHKPGSILLAKVALTLWNTGSFCHGLLREQELFKLPCFFLCNYINYCVHHILYPLRNFCCSERGEANTRNNFTILDNDR